MMLGEPCRYVTPCGWCWKWDKKCDNKIGCEPPSVPMPESHAQKFINVIKSSKLPPIGASSDFGLQNLNEKENKK